jgi:hypothetical protein
MSETMKSGFIGLKPLYRQSRMKTMGAVAYEKYPRGATLADFWIFQDQGRDFCAGQNPSSQRYDARLK